MAMKQVLGRSQCRVVAKAAQVPSPRTSHPSTTAKIGVVGLATASLVQVAPALAANVDADVDAGVNTAVDNIIAVVKGAAGLVKAGVGAVESGVKIAQQGYEVAAPVIKQGIQTVAPIVQQGAQLAADAATPVIRAALPAVNDAGTALGESIKSTTNLDGVIDTTGKVIGVAAPVAAQAANFVTNNDPVTIAQYGLGSVALFYILPPVLGLFGGSFRGFAGEITPAQVLDSLSDGSCVLVDLRTQKEKEGSGVPDVPGSASGRCLDVEFAVTEDKKLRNSLRDPTAIEASVTSLQIASLKRVTKSTKIILLDKNGSASQAVAKELARKGFGKVYTVQGGFDGRGGWVQSKLQIKPAATVLSAPSLLSRLGSSGVRTGTSGTSRKSLPAPRA